MDNKTIKKMCMQNNLRIMTLWFNNYLLKIVKQGKMRLDNANLCRIVYIAIP